MKNQKQKDPVAGEPPRRYPNHTPKGYHNDSLFIMLRDGHPTLRKTTAPGHLTQGGILFYSQLSQTSGQNPTVACLPLRTMGVRIKSGSSKTLSSLATLSSMYFSSVT